MVNSNNSLIKMLLRIIFIIVCILLIINFSRALFNGADLSFSSFLNWLSTVDSFKLTVNIQNFAISGNWGPFDFLRGFLNIFANLFGVIVFMFANLVNLLIFASQFISFVMFRV